MASALISVVAQPYRAVARRARCQAAPLRCIFDILAELIPECKLCWPGRSGFWSTVNDYGNHRRRVGRGASGFLATVRTTGIFDLMQSGALGFLSTVKGLGEYSTSCGAGRSAF